MKTLALFSDGPARGRVIEVVGRPSVLHVPAIGPFRPWDVPEGAVVDVIPVDTYDLKAGHEDAAIYALRRTPAPGRVVVLAATSTVAFHALRRLVDTEVLDRKTVRQAVIVTGPHDVHRLYGLDGRDLRILYANGHGHARRGPVEARLALLRAMGATEEDVQVHV